MQKHAEKELEEEIRHLRRKNQILQDENISLIKYTTYLLKEIKHLRKKNQLLQDENIYLLKHTTDLLEECINKLNAYKP